MAVFGILGDIHGNAEALDAALGALDALGIARIFCVGDLVGYNADPDRCVSLLRERGVLSIAGNHDLIGTRRLGFERCSNKAMHALKRTRRMLGRETVRYLEGLPAHHIVDDRVLLTHGGVRDVQQYMTRPAYVLENAHYLRADFPGIEVCFFGHTHEQRVFRCEGETASEIPLGDGRVRLAATAIHFVNPGSVDASRKRTKLAEFAVFDSAAAQVAFHRVAYDAARTEAKAAAAGMRIGRWRDRLYDYQRRLERLAARPARSGE